MKVSRWRGIVTVAGERPFHTWCLAVILGYLVLVVCGITTSSAGIQPLQDDGTGAARGLILGDPDAIRSDEFLRVTPWRIGLTAEGDDSFATPLSHPDPALAVTAPGGPVTSVLFPDTSVVLQGVGRVAASAAFAAVWWLPVLLVALLLPLWFRRFGVGIHISGPVTVLVVLSPVALWWTWGPLVGLGWALVAAEGAAAGVRRMVNRSWLLGSALLLVAAFGLARLALSYQPWAIPLGLTVLVPTLFHLLQPREGRLIRALACGATVVVGAALFGAFLLEHRSGVSVLSSTVYPGARRYTGSLTSLAALFGAPHLQILNGHPAIVGTNASELSAGFTVLGVAGLALAAAIRWERLRDVRLPIAASVGVLLCLTAWCTFDWPEKAARLFPANLVNPDRLVQVLGISAAITFGLVLDAWRRAPATRSRLTVIVVGALCFIVTAAGGSQLRQVFIPSLTPTRLLVVSVLTAVAVAVAVAKVSRVWSLVPLAALACAIAVGVNPLQVGFGDLRDGAAAGEVRAVTADLSAGERWASDDLYVDALLMSNAAPSLSGQQWIGPDEQAWAILDPRGQYRDTWNRGASYVHFGWLPAGEPLRVELPNPDVIWVRADPCDARLKRLGLARVVASEPLDGSCLTLDRSVTFGGRPRAVYRVATSTNSARVTTPFRQ